MMKHEYEPNDFRKIELKYRKVLYNSIFIELTQFELLKIRKSLKLSHNKELALKIEKFIKAIDHETNKPTNFERKLPYKTNGTRVKQWTDFKDFQTLD